MITRLGLLGCILVLLFTAGGCVERTLSIQSDPPGALVYLNDEEIGRTPVRKDFTWYGKYEVTLRKDGYQTLKTTKTVDPPIYQWIPLDLVSDLLPFTIKDQHQETYTLQPEVALTPDQSEAMLARAQEMRSQLEGTRRPATRPASTTRSANK